MSKKKLYILLDQHRQADGSVLEKGDSIKLTAKQALNLNNKIRDPSAEVSVEVSPEVTNLVEQLKSAQKELVVVQEQSEVTQDKIKEVTTEQIWDCYSKAVGGKSFTGDPLPPFDKLGKQSAGWDALVDLIHALGE